MVLTGSVELGEPEHRQRRDLDHDPRQEVVTKYLANFNYEWDNKRNSRNAYTTTYGNFRVARMVRDADGSARKV